MIFMAILVVRFTEMSSIVGSEVLLKKVVDLTV